jgi:putative serine protease PepD
LVDSAGRVVGINTAIATAGQGEGNIGVGFAIPSNTAKQIADRIMTS